MGISAVIVSRNGGPGAAALAAALAGAPGVAEVLLADDHSSDGSAALAAAAGARVVSAGRRLGPGPLRDLALRAAACDLVLFLDCDVRPDPGLPGLLRSALEAAGAAAACPAVMAGDSGLAQYGPGRCHVLGLSDFLDVFAPEPGASPCGPLSAFSSACFLVDRRLLPAGLAFDPSYFFWCEDTDYSLRLALGGGKIVYEPRARARHLKPGLAPGAAPDPAGRHFFHPRNRRLTLVKNFPWRLLAAALPAHLLYEALAFAHALRGGAGLGYLRGWLSFLRLLPGALRARRPGSAAALRGLLSFGPAPLRPAFRRGPSARAARLLDAACAACAPLARGAL